MGKRSGKSGRSGRSGTRTSGRSGRSYNHLPQQMGGKARPVSHSGKEALRKRPKNTLPKPMLRCKRKTSLVELAAMARRHRARWRPSAEETVVQTPMAIRGHASTAQSSMDRFAGAVIYHQYVNYDGTVWENGITMVDPARDNQLAGDANWEELEQWSRNA